MARYEILKNAVADVIKTNGNNEITGALLQQSLLAIINSLGADYQLVGYAYPATNPGTPDQNVAYIAARPGTYPNFGSISINENEVALLKFDGTWHKETTDIASVGLVSSFEDRIESAEEDIYDQNTEIANFKAAITQLINDYQPIIINGDVTNAPDQEDITTDANDLLKFANRGTLNGKGFIIVRKEQSFESQVTVANTIYEIRYNFVLSGTFTLPANSILNFVGGSISGGTLNLNNCYILGNAKITSNVSGHLSNQIYFAQWFGVVGDGTTDDTAAMQRALNVIYDNTLYISGFNAGIKITDTLNLNASAQHGKKIIGAGGYGNTFLISNFGNKDVFHISTGGYSLTTLAVINTAQDKTGRVFHFENSLIFSADGLGAQHCNIAILYDHDSGYGRINGGSIYKCTYGFYCASANWCGALSLNAVKITGCDYGAYVDGYLASTIFNDCLFEGCQNKLFFNTSATQADVIFNDCYFGDESEIAITVKAGNVLINGSTAFGGNHTGDFKPNDNDTLRQLIKLDGGTLRLQNIKRIIAASVSVAVPSGATAGNANVNACIVDGSANANLFIDNCFVPNLTQASRILGDGMFKNLEKIPSYIVNGAFKKNGTCPFLADSGKFQTYYDAGLTINWTDNDNEVGGKIIQVSKVGTKYPVTKVHYEVPRPGIYYYVVRFSFESYTNKTGFNMGVYTPGTAAMLNDNPNIEKMSLSSWAWYGWTFPVTANYSSMLGKVFDVYHPIQIDDVSGDLFALFNSITGVSQLDYVLNIHFMGLVEQKDALRIGVLQDMQTFLTSGPTDRRPANPYIGFVFYDTTLSKSIVWNGTNWVNMDGSALS